MGNKIRSLTGLILAAIAVLIVGCGGAQTAEPEIYSAKQIELINVYATGVLALRERMPELESAIDQDNWVDVQSFIHGPLGELRTRTARLARELLPNDQSQAEDLAKDLYKHLVKIDQAADERNTAIAAGQYIEALKDFDAYLDLLPQPGL
ncbi:MAG: photosystem II protein PsbQ [Cyanobacteria bacterium P01_C01_bin.73]